MKPLGSFFALVAGIFIGTPAYAEPPFPRQYTVDLVPGYTSIANQLDRGNNTLNEVLTNVPPGSFVLKWDPVSHSFVQSTYSSASQNWSPNLALAPGDGALFHSDIAFTLTFSGLPRVPGAAGPLTRGIFYYLSRQTNAPGTYENIIGTPPVEGAIVYRYDVATQPSPAAPTSWPSFTFAQGTWTPQTPQARVGEALMFYLPPQNPPIISVQPQSQTVTNCDTAIFTVAAEGTPPLTYQWRSNRVAIAGATNSTLLLPAVQSYQAGNYDVMVFNRGVGATSTVARLTVIRRPVEMTCPPDVIASADFDLCGARNVTLGNASGGDGCGTFKVTNNAPEVFPLGDTLVTWTAVGPEGEAATCDQRVTVVDLAPPWLICPTGLVAGCASPAGIRVEYGVKAIDNCGSATVQCVPPSGSVFPLGTNIVTCIAVDAATNIAVCGFPVVVTTECRPVLRVVSVSQTSFVMTFDTQAGTPYAIESTDHLAPALWQTTTTVSGTGNSVLITNQITTVSNRFYRVKIGSL